MTGGRGARLLRRGCCVAVAAMAVLAGGGAPAQAHAFLVSSDPGDGSVLVSAPTQLTLRLSEAVVLPATRVTLVDHDQQPVALGAPTPAAAAPAHDAAPAPEPPGSAPSLVPAPVTEDEPPMTLVVPVRGAMAKGSYRLTVDTLSADDMHRTTAVVVFGIGQRVVAAGRTEPPVPVDQALLRWLALIGLAAALGHLLFLRLAAGSPTALAVVRRTRRPVLGILLAAGLACVSLPLAQAMGSGVPVGTLLAGTYGVRVALRALGLVVLAVAVAGRPGRGDRVTGGLAVAGLLATATGTALLGHAGAAPVGPLHLGSDIIHVVATATWLGGVTMVALLAWAARRGSVSGTELRHVVRRFAAPATTCVVAMVASGLVLASTSVASVDAVLITTYGRTLLLKVSLVGLAALLGWRHFRWGRHHNGGRPPWTTVAEAGLLGGSLVLAALLSSGQPATTPELSSAGDVAASVAADTNAADLAEHVVVQPNRPGSNIAVVQVLDSRRPAPPRPTSVRVEWRDGSGRVSVGDAQALPEDGWSLPVQFESPGTTRMRIVVQRPGLPDAVSSTSWVVGGAAAPPATVVSRTPVGPLLQGVSAVLAALALVAALTLLLRRRPARRRTTAPPPEQHGVAAGRPLEHEQAGHEQVEHEQVERGERDRAVV